ncbi:MAG: hypothetical protein SGBAC_007605 [Bacillariaceae sp.]
MSNHGCDSKDPTTSPINFDCDLDYVLSLISSQVEKLSSSQIVKTYSDIHGTSVDIEESSQLISTALRQMEENVSSIIEKQAYDLAKSVDPKYVESPQLRLIFLRGTGFKPKPAAEKLVRFFEIKREFFGSRKLVKDIRQSDLEERDIEYLYSGHIQWLPLKDSSGRLVTIMYPGPQERGVRLESMLRVAIYLRMVAIEDLQIQRKGFVFVLSAADIERGLEIDLPKVKRYVNRFIEIQNAMPGTLQALHIISRENHNPFNEYIFAMTSQFVVLAMRPSEVVRVRIKNGETLNATFGALHWQYDLCPLIILTMTCLHHIKLECSQSEIQDYLNGFGILSDLIPPSEDTTIYAALLAQRRALERLRQPNERAFEGHQVESVCMPSPFDVISGRGRSLMEHHGNRILRNLVEEQTETYAAATRQDKKLISSEVVRLIKKKGRFLKKHLHGWVEIDAVAARLKVSHVFRDSRASSQKFVVEETVDQEDAMSISGHDGIGSFDFGSSDGDSDVCNEWI